MKKFGLIVFLLSSFLILFLFACNSGDQNSDGGTEFDTHGQAGVVDDVSNKNILQIAISSPDHTTLVAGVQAAELENILVNPGPLTVFAPTDAAFAALPEGTVENLVKPENKNVLADILKYHVTPGNLSVSILTKLPKLGQANNQYVQIEVIDGKPVIGGANIIATVKAGNGVVHVIDKVLLPPTKE